EPGHTRPHPGAVEFTGSWCDFHYGVLAVTHPLAPVGTFVWLAVIAAVIFTAGPLMRGGIAKARRRAGSHRGEPNRGPAPPNDRPAPRRRPVEQARPGCGGG